jgi:hypothetical protein
MAQPLAHLKRTRREAVGRCKGSAMDFQWSFPNPITFNIEQLCDVLNYGVATFFVWADLFWLEQTYKNSADVI